MLRPHNRFFARAAFHAILLLTLGLLVSGRIALAAEVIVDNGGAGWSFNGSWTTATASNDYGSNYAYRAIATSSSRYARWTPAIPTAGNYSVYAWWPTDSNAFNNARFTISYNGGSATVYKDQTLTPGQWVLLGTWNFAAGSVGYVQLSNQGSDTSKLAVADAIRFTTPVSLNMAVSPDSSGTTSPAVGGPYSYMSGDTVSISATPAPGYSFVQWSVSAGSAVASPTSPSTTVTLDVSKTVTAVFQSTIITLTMAVSPAGGGTTTPAIGGPYEYNVNDVVSISAIPAAGYRFVNWTVSAGSNVANPTSASTTVTMDQAKTVIAVFEQIALTMAVTPGGAGTTTPAAGGPYPYNENDVVSISATPASGFRFVNWTVSGGSGVANPTNASTTVTMDQAKTVTAVFAPTIQLTVAVSPPGAGTATPAAGGSYDQNAGDVVSLTATPAPGYVFSRWLVSAGTGVVYYTSPTTTVTIDQSKTVTAVFVPIQLNVDVWPAGAGVTTPAVGGPYPKGSNEVVSIQVTPNAGYTFNHWAVSAGVQVANPTATSTTVSMDTVKTVTAVFDPLPSNPPQFRAVWAAAFQSGFMSAAEVDTMINYMVVGHYNVLLMEVMAYQDSPDPPSNSHGAYWKSNIVPWSPKTTAGFDPLAYVVQQAHANGIQVDAWLIPYRVSAVWPPRGNSVIPASGQWLMVPPANKGTVAKFDGTNYWLDPGSPDVQNYLVSIVRELVSNYDIDGIHWDYEIGSGPKDNWFYADANYGNSGVARFKRIYGYGSDPATTDSNWANFRRREVTELHARVKAEIDSITTNRRRPLRHTDSTMAYDPVPACTTAGYQGSSAYIYFGDVATWLGKGYTDGAIPMVYKCGAGNSFNGWVDYFSSCFAYPSVYPRPTYIGQGNYRLNPMSDSVTQMQYVYARGITGISNYDYWYTLGNGSCSTGSNDTSWWSTMSNPVNNLYVNTAPVPRLTWRDPIVATEGTLWGRITRNGVPVDNANVTINTTPSSSAQTDGSGYYLLTLLPATLDGTGYSVTATSVPDAVTSPATVFVGDIRRLDIELVAGCVPTVSRPPLPQDVCPGGTATFMVGATCDPASLTYQWQKNGADLSDGGHYSGVSTATLTVTNADESDVAAYRCVVTNPSGSATSGPAALTLKAATAISQQPDSQAVCPGGTAAFTCTGDGSGTVTYQWQKSGVNLAEGGHYAGVTTGTLTVSSATGEDAANYRCIVTASCGSVTSNDAALTLKPATVITQQPSSGSICPGGTLQFSLAAAGEGPFTYLWYHNGQPLVEGGHFSGTSGATLTVSNADATDAGEYYCVVTGGCGAVTSNTVVLTVMTAPSISQQPAPQVVCPGDTAQFTVSASGDNLTYHWQKGTTPITDGGRFAGATTASLTITSVGSGDLGDYSCVITGACGTITSDAAALGLCHRSILQWWSAKNYGGNSLGIQLAADALADAATVETRQGGVEKIAVVFDGAVTLGNTAAITVVAGETSYTPAVTVAGDTMTLAFSPALPDAACYLITIGSGAIGGILDDDSDCLVRALVGDVTQNGSLNLGDALYVRTRIGQAVGSNPAFDIDLNGVIDAADVQAVKALVASPSLQVTCP